MTQVNQVDKPPEVDLSGFEPSKIQESLAAVREVVLTELLKSVKAIERAENGAIIHSEELRAQHDRTVELTTAALTMVESEEYTVYVVNTVEDRERTPVRKKKTDWMLHEVLHQTDYAGESKEENIARLLKLRSFAHEAYETAFAQMEDADNGNTEITTAQAYVLTTQQNFTGLIIPLTDSAEFFWDWKLALTEAYRDPDRMGEDGDDFI